MRLEKLWNYYKTQAVNAGKVMEKGNPKQGPYSIAWFYQSYKGSDLKKTLNPLTQAFLGDETAYRSICRAPEDQLEKCREDVTAFFERKALKPNAAQIDAIANASSNRISIIQGPPGTGKTETIKDLLLYLMQLDPVPTVAVVSSNGMAISNITEKVKADSTLCSRCASLGNRKMRGDFRRGPGKGISTRKVTKKVLKETGEPSKKR